MRTVTLVASALAACLLGSAPPASAQFKTGNQIIGAMKEYRKYERGDRKYDVQSSAFWLGYVTGVADAQSDSVCFPQGVTVGQLAAVAAKFLDSHPEKWNLAASDILVASWQEAFPCPVSPPPRKK